MPYNVLEVPWSKEPLWCVRRMCGVVWHDRRHLESCPCGTLKSFHQHPFGFWLASLISTLHLSTFSKIGTATSKSSFCFPAMPRGKKKATVAEAPPSTPPSAKKRKIHASTEEGDVPVSSADLNNARITTRASSRTDATYSHWATWLICRNGKKSANKRTNVDSSLMRAINGRFGIRNVARNGLMDTVNVLSTGLTG